MGTTYEDRIEELLELGAPYEYENDSLERSTPRFRVTWSVRDYQHYVIHDNFRRLTSYLPTELARDHSFNVIHWYEFRLAQFELDKFDFLPPKPPKKPSDKFTQDMAAAASNEERWPHVMEYVDDLLVWMSTETTDTLELNGVQVDRGKYAAIQRNSATVKDKARVLPKPVVIKVLINGQPVRALIDSGSQGDFLSTTLADQLNLKKEEMTMPLKLQLAVQGSRSVVNFCTEARLQYQGIDEVRKFDIINLNNYDAILGTPWLYQHQVCFGFNPARVLIGSDIVLPIKTGADTKMMVNALSLDEGKVEAAREELRRYAEPLCRDVSETELPPFRVINHTIPLIDEKKTYPWRPSRCPEAFRAQWAEKRDAYLKSGRWKITSAGNTVPMLLIPKPKKDGAAPELRTVFDLRERNKNTYKLTSPLPDMEGMLRRASKHKFRTALDLKSAYEQIRIVPEHVERSTVTTPDGNMVSQVIPAGRL